MELVLFSMYVTGGYCLETLPSSPGVFFADDNEEKYIQEMRRLKN